MAKLFYGTADDGRLVALDVDSKACLIWDAKKSSWVEDLDLPDSYFIEAKPISTEEAEAIMAGSTTDTAVGAEFNSHEATKALQLTESQLESLFRSIIAKALMPLSIIIIYSAVQLFRKEYGRMDYAILIIGSIVSIVGFYALTFDILIYSIKKKQSWFASMLALAGFIPYLFALYLIFYKGLWSLKELRGGFSLMVLAGIVVYVIFGVVVLYEIYRLSEIARNVSDGKIKITDEKPGDVM